LLLALLPLATWWRPLTQVDLDLHGLVPILDLLDDPVHLDHRVLLRFLVLHGPRAALLLLINSAFPLLMNVNLNVSEFFLLLCEVIQHMVLVVDIEIVTRGTRELNSFGRV
jgi:hypothetical protein